ncbi:MAG: HAMP domain-containing protein [Clostridiales bacterium]|uniref:methyl-accepting chemotaxis protein n=1 Tax=Clostridium sp. N3C TaxID=1776758 RepID=UPI00092DF800|nr:cache domain-containing protein [Clostridium sp. N3C]NLZ48895.1 HAMP domain-containing protein [Clostridiales bacterium]SCN24900.1 Methyl-accepting chemotaxis protein 4 [Clostridium sp. N3C]
MKKLSHKIIVMSIAICLILGATLSTTSIISIITANNNYLSELDQTLRDQYDQKTKLQVETAISMLTKISDMEKKGRLTHEEALNLGADLLRELRYGKEGYFWADTPDGTNVVLLGSETEGTNRYNLQDTNGTFYMQEIINNGLQEGGGFSEYWFPKKGETEPSPKRAYSILFEPFNWVIGTGNYIDDIDKEIALKEEEISQNTSKIMILLSVLLFTILAIAIIASVIIGFRISKPIVSLTALFKKAEAGDLTVRSNCNNKDETGQLSKAFNNMMNNMMTLIKGVKELSFAVSESSQGILASSNEISTASEQIALTTNELAEASINQAKYAENSNAKLSEILDGLSKINEEMENSKQLSLKANEIVNTGEKIVQSNEEKTMITKEAAMKVNKVIAILEEKSNTIGHIVEVINSISDQTNLLALNAAIEAARAGEAGKGFSVVADEIRKLAEQSSSSAKQIGDIIAEIKDSIDQSVIEINKSSVAVAEQEKALTETVNVFNEISISVDTITDKIKQVVESSNLLSSRATEAVEAASSIVSLTEEAASSTEEVSASTQEQTSVIHQIASSAKDLAELSSKLQKEIDKFIV